MINLLLKNGSVYIDGAFRPADVLINDGIVVSLERGVQAPAGFSVLDITGKQVLPGFADMHVHFREPGFSYKETIKTGSMAAAKGGFTLVCTMPNVRPAPDSMESLRAQLDIIERDAVIAVLPFGCITKGQAGRELSDFSGMAASVAGFSDDGKGVEHGAVMEAAMGKARALGRLISAHCEDKSLIPNGAVIHDGTYAREHGYKGIPSASETAQAQRDIELNEAEGGSYHICHVSAKETVEAVRKAKANGQSVSCETCPHYLAFCDEDLQEDGRFKMNPPIRSKEDRAALIEGVKDGTIDAIVTDHAPHSEEEKSGGLANSPMGVVGLETSYAAANTFLVKAGHIGPERLAELMSINPRKLLGLPWGIKPGSLANITVTDPDASWTVHADTFVSKGRATPFDGMELYGSVIMTIYDGNIVYRNNIQLF